MLPEKNEDTFPDDLVKLQTTDSQLQMLYEINNDPNRKEFLDDLFSFMQKRGTPINRLPIMAKSVLDLYELYNLVIARGGLVDVINKKLWQEIIKGLHLPSSITSAAFTLRTQYMKYLYPYECDRRQLSTPAELQAAIDGNRREGRRSGYSSYVNAGENVVQRMSQTPSSMALRQQMSPLSLVTAVAGGQHHGPQTLVNGSAVHTPLSHHSHHQQGPMGQPAVPGLSPDFQERMVEYLKLFKIDVKTPITAEQLMLLRQSVPSPTRPTSPRDSSFNILDMSKLQMWNMFNNNTLYPGVGAHHQTFSPQPVTSPVQREPSPEPQREALDLGLRSPSTSATTSTESPLSSAERIQIKNEQDLIGRSAPLSIKRLKIDDEPTPPVEREIPLSNPRTNITISNRGDGQNGENSLDVSIELNGTMYEGVLFAQTASMAPPSTSSTKTSRSLVS